MTNGRRKDWLKWLTRKKSKKADNEVYLAYHDVTITNADMWALKNDWLTDINITFWEEWIEREVLPQYPEARVVLLRPTMTVMLAMTTDPIEIASGLPSFEGVTHVFIPINDVKDTGQSDNGTHWSLLLVSIVDAVAFHYDSLGGSNFFPASKVTDRLSKLLGTPLRFYQMEDTPQQDNTSDCGVFVCILIRHLLLKRLLNANGGQKVSMSMKGKVIDSYNGRKEMLKIMEAVRREAVKRRSESPQDNDSSKASTIPRID
ncbi:nedd8-specific protease-like protein [Cladorrhinum sp. PSN259]|nr:nedd8-specific protease-like protein [Cladorrhinum sp. PSN259]